MNTTTFAVVLLAFMALHVAVATSSVLQSPFRQFEEFKRTYRKVYADEAEEKQRFHIFLENLARAHALNTATGNQAEYGVTQFMDLSADEFRSRFLMREFDTSAYDQASVLPVPPLNAAPPSSYDWRTKGAVTPVYNQEQCGSCWAFSTTEAIESQWFLAGHNLTKLSMQQIVSCDHTDGGCNGGNPPTAYEYVIKAGGLESYSSYPYTSGTGRNGQCSFQKSKVVASIKNWAYVSKRSAGHPAGNESALIPGTYQYGPLSICVDATTWQTYRGGVVTSNCGSALDHCVQLVGWNNDAKPSTPYYLVRNSWGATWGEAGYIYIEQGKNLCGIADEATRPIV